MADVSSLGQIYPSALSFFILTGLFSIFSFVLTKYFDLFFYSDNTLKNTYIYSAFIGNYVFLGWGIINSFYGEQAFTRAVFFTMFFWPVFLFWGFSLLILRIDKESNNEPINKKKITKIIFSKALIPILSALAGILMNVFEIKIPDILWRFIKDFAAITIPMILFTIGLNFKIKMKTNAIKITLASSFSRLIIGFVFGLITVYLVSSILIIDKLTIKVVLLESIMPTAAMSVFFIDYADIDKEVLSGSITMSTLLSLLTIPFWYYIIEQII